VPENSQTARAIAFYLPQFHPIPENDRWWGKGFTEWTNTAKARPLFRGHYQPHVPADLGFYDLRVPETRIAQAEMAREYRVEAFCYYHYWFAGKRLLERPFEEVLQSGEPDFPFCLCWANQTWTGIWHGAPGRVLIEQTYPGIDDHQRHFKCLLRAFRDRRYLTVDDKPVLLIYKPMEIPHLRRVTDFWRELAEYAGLRGLYLIGYSWDPSWVPDEHGFDASFTEPLPRLRQFVHVSRRTPIKWFVRQHQIITGKPTIYSHEQVVREVPGNNGHKGTTYPCVIPNWDNTPRSGRNGLVLHGSSPELFKVALQQALEAVNHLQQQQRLLFIKSWNEWAEGNHLEPDLKFGKRYLEAMRDVLLT
jgi:hypothetical protein